jgi:hypothetical protein
MYNTQTDTTLTVFQVSEMAEAVLKLGTRHHYSFRLIADFRGPINGPVFNTKGDWVYMPFREEDREIIPNAAFRMHRDLKKDRQLNIAGYRDLQVIIGHEVRERSESSVVLPPAMPLVITPAYPVIPAKPKPKIDWEMAAGVAGGLLVGMMGIAMVSINALLGTLALVDPSYCICLDDDLSTVIELLRWDTEV